jgi:hypothetical protein
MAGGDGFFARVQESRGRLHTQLVACGMDFTYPTDRCYQVGFDDPCLRDRLAE